MDEFTDPELQAAEAREQRRMRRRERIERRKQRLEETEQAMTEAAVAAAAAEARKSAPPEDAGEGDGKPPRKAPPAGGGEEAREDTSPRPSFIMGGGGPKKAERPQGKGGTPARVESESRALTKARSTEIAEQPPQDAYEIARIAREARMKQIRRELRRRRRLRALWILFRFWLFVLLPTSLVGYYYYEKATDMYVSKASMIFKSGSMDAGGGLLSAFGGFGNMTDSVSVQEYILSVDILERLQREHGLIDHFKQDSIDWWHRLPAEANIDQAHKYYAGGLITPGKVEVSYDATEGIIRMELTAADPDSARRFAQAIISYSEELVNSLNERSRNDGVRFAEQKVAEARSELLDAQRRVAAVQEKLEIFSVQGEAGVLQSRIAGLEVEIDEIEQRIATLRTIARDESDSRYVPLRLDLAQKNELLEELRSRLTGGEAATGPSMAQLSSEEEIARVEQTTANMLYASALSSLETAIATAAAQSLYLETVVQPNLPEKASKPERLINTALVFLILFATYIIGLLTISLIREQAAI